MTKMKAVYSGELQVELQHENGAKMMIDAPKESGGQGQFFSPTDLVAAALASCLLMVMGIAAKKLGVAFEETQVEIEKEMGAGFPRRIGKLVIRIRSPQSFAPHVREKLEKAALECPVHHSLHPETQKEFDFVWG